MEKAIHMMKKNDFKATFFMNNERHKIEWVDHKVVILGWLLWYILWQIGTAMNYVHYKVTLGPQKVVQVSLNRQAYVRLMDTSNYNRYVMRKAYEYTGGLAETSPINMIPPHHDTWHVVVDLNGKAGQLKAKIKIIER